MNPVPAVVGKSTRNAAGSDVLLDQLFSSFWKVGDRNPFTVFKAIQDFLLFFGQFSRHVFLQDIAEWPSCSG